MMTFWPQSFGKHWISPEAEAVICFLRSRLRQTFVSPTHSERPLYMERKLAAILAADVVGYSLLMEMDEAVTFERMKGCREELPRRVTDGFDQVRIAL